MLKKDDKAKVVKTGEIGYVESVSESGERVTVRIPPSESWPFMHYVHIAREGLVYLNDRPKSKSESKSESKPLDWRGPF